MYETTLISIAPEQRLHMLVGRRVDCPEEHSGREMAPPEVQENRKKTLDDTNDDVDS